MQEWTILLQIIPVLGNIVRINKGLHGSANGQGAAPVQRFAVEVGGDVTLPPTNTLIKSNVAIHVIIALCLLRLCLYSLCCFI